MIFLMCHSKGALASAKKKVNIKRLDAIQNLGAIDILFSDKTGTLTMDAIILERRCDVNAVERDELLQSAFLVSHFQTGLHSALGVAILADEKERELDMTGTWHTVDEVPFDFTR